MAVINWAKGMLEGLITVLIGMRITIKQMFVPPVTMHYPDEKWTVAERFRGLIKCDTDACIVCDQCKNICPPACIDIPWKREPGVSGKMVVAFTIDYSKCIFCGLCVEVCPVTCIYHSHDYEIASYTRDPQIIDWAQEPYKHHWHKSKPKPGAKKEQPKPATVTKPAASQTQTVSATATATVTTTATAGSVAGAASSVTPLENKPEYAGKIINVWIAEGCIVCDLCETTCPDVFDVTETTCRIRDGSQPKWPELTDAIVKAAEECPVNVIKYAKGG